MDPITQVVLTIDMAHITREQIDWLHEIQNKVTAQKCREDLARMKAEIKLQEGV